MPQSSTPIPLLVRQIDERSGRDEDELLGFLMHLSWPSLAAQDQ